MDKLTVKSNNMLFGKLEPYKIASKQRSQREMARKAIYDQELEQAAKLGKEAREAFEKQYQNQLDEEMRVDNEKRRKFYLQLLAMGINPSGIEGQQRVWKFEHDIDLSSIRGTEQERLISERGSRGGDAYEARAKRMERIELESLMDDNVDLVAFYMVKNEILNGKEMGAAIHSELQSGDKFTRLKINREISKIETKFRQEGKASPPRDYDAVFDEVDLDEVIVLRQGKIEEPKKKEVKVVDKEIEKEQKRILKLREKEEKNRIKAEQKAESDRLKVEKAMEREKLNKKKLAEKEAAKATAAAEAEAQKAAMAVEVTVNPSTEAEFEVSLEEPFLSNEEEVILTSSELNTDLEATPAKNFVLSAAKVPSAAIIAKISGGAAILGGGIYSLNRYLAKAAEDEAERQRKFNLLMGIGETNPESKNEISMGIVNGDSSPLPATSRSTLDDLESLISGEEKPKPAISDATIPSTPISDSASISGAPKKKRNLLGSIFKKDNSNGREASLENVLSPEVYPVTASYAQLLSQYLTVGAPGRFPQLERGGKLQNVKDDNGVFRPETAKENLVTTKSKLGISDEDAAECFANVVNAMIIQLIDLASSATQVGKTAEEKEKSTVDALNVVLDYMDHAASLFDAVAQNVTITPVTYGGNLGKSMLEQMYSAYVSAAMIASNETVTGRMEVLQQVFNIPDKKAEGIAQKLLIKNLPKMMEGVGGEGGMEEMLAAMGGGLGADGFPGIGNDEELSPEMLMQSMEQMKELVKSGQVSKDDLDMVRKQYREMRAAAGDEELTNEEKQFLKQLEDVIGIEQ